MQIKVYEKVEQRPHGDRDTRTHPCSSFKVVLINNGLRATVFSNNQWNGFHCHIKGTRAEYLNQAMDRASQIATVLGAAEIVGVDQTKHEVRAAEVRAEIKKLQDELELLKEINPDV